MAEKKKVSNTCTLSKSDWEKRVYCRHSFKDINEIPDSNELLNLFLIILGGLFVYQAIMGIIGGVVGIILGIIIAIIVNIGGITIPPPPILSRNIVLHIMLVPKVIIQSFVIAVVISFLSSIVPIRKAARMNITDALRHI